MMKWQDNKNKSAKKYEEAKMYLEDRERKEREEEIKSVQAPRRNN
jgi:hypothetical protein